MRTDAVRCAVLHPRRLLKAALHPANFLCPDFRRDSEDAAKCGDESTWLVVANSKSNLFDRATTDKEFDSSCEAHLLSP